MSAFNSVVEFERAIAEYAGAKHGIAVDCCTSGIFLSLQYYKGFQVDEVICPAKTYASVPMAVLHCGLPLALKPIWWRGVYQLSPYPIWDGAKRFKRGMYQGGLHCLSFHAKKHIPIGRGGMVLTDDEDAARWLRKARYDGREGKPYPDEQIDQLGWHMYMTPEQASRGLLLFETRASDSFEDLLEDYPDLRQMPLFRRHCRETETLGPGDRPFSIVEFK